MSLPPRLSVETNIDMECGCFVRFVYGGVDEYMPHTHEFYEIFIIAKGTVSHMVNGTMQHLPEGSLVFIRPDDVHSHLCTDPNTAFINLTFTCETTEKLFEYLFDEEKKNRMLHNDMPPMIFLDRSTTKKFVSQIMELGPKSN